VSRQLFNFRNVPEDESAEVRALLDEHAIAYYETPPSRWGISMGAIWLSNSADYPRARHLLDDYQTKRARKARAEYAERKQKGQVETFTALFRQRPAEVLLYLLGAAAVVGVMMWPVWLLMG
jgi:hypothetical protein